MKSYLINNNSDNLLIFFTGWGCDECEFEHLKSSCDVLLLYDYNDLTLEFDFSKYKNIDLMAFSAGVFVGAVMDFDFKINKKIALSGNPYLFDEKLGLSCEVQELLCGITEENADDFARNYLVKTDEEWKIFHHSKRSLKSCRAEFDSLKELYNENQDKIKDIYDIAIFGIDDKIFSIPEQKNFYGNRIKLVKNARHSLFFKIDSYEQIFEDNKWLH